MRSLVPPTLLFGATLFTVTAVAQESSDEIARRELIAGAEQARDAGDHARALDLATRASRLRMTPSLRQLIAYEHDALGHTLDAFDVAGRCAREAEIDAALRNRDVILSACRTLLEALRGRVGRVVLRVPDASATGLRVLVQSSEIPAALWGVAYPVLPGNVRVEATRADGATFARTVTVEGGDQVDVAITLTEPARPSRAPARAPGLGPWIVAGSGALALITGGALVVMGNGARADRDAECDASGAGRCGEVAQTWDDRYRGFTTAGQVAIGVGAAAVVGGALWFVLARALRADARGGAHVLVSPVAQGAQLVVGGAL